MNKSNFVVSKFGGTSMGNAETMLMCAELSYIQKSSIIVVSATSGTTNLLLELGQASENQNVQKMTSIVETLSSKHIQILENLKGSSAAKAQINQLIEEMQSLSKGIYLLKDFSHRNSDALVSIGERLSSILFCQALKNRHHHHNSKFNVELIDARKMIITDTQFSHAIPQISAIKSKCQELIPQLSSTVFVTQGFIGSTSNGQTTTLGRGGSDFSAALFAEAIEASILEIWTDVPGIATTDPRICKEAQIINEISFTEASELATFGAKVLHPATLLPAVRQNIPVFVGSSFEPKNQGTWVKKNIDQSPLVRAMAVRRNQKLVTLTTPQMWQTHGFLFQIFKVFNQHKISVDAVTTSEISVAITLDASVNLPEVAIQELSQFAEVHIENHLSLISLIGNNINHTPGLAEKAFRTIPDVNIRMICQGASRHNFCFLVADEIASQVIQKLHQQFITQRNLQ